ncbi:MAG: hypothetical protein FWG42_10580 [Clostridiales bacterium]|nr:hypothetical protein [Clostridiales bacterium]
MNALLIYNPEAGGKSFASELDGVIEKLQSRGLVLTLYRMGSAARLDEFLATQEGAHYDRIIVAGGDGSVSSTASALLKRGIDLPIGIIPIGTTNDFAKHFGLPTDIDGIAGIIARDGYACSDIAKINGETFINAVLVGFREFQTLSPFKAKIESGELCFEGEIFMALVMNGRSTGGFARIAKDAAIDDGLLDVLIVKKCPLVELAPLLVSLGSGRHKDSKHILHFQTSGLKVSSEARVSVRADGEEGAVLPIEISVQGSKLKVLSDATAVMKPTGGVFSFGEVLQAAGGLVEIIKDMPRHNVLEYVNRSAIEKAYFEEAEASLADGYIYVVLSSTGTAAGELIRSVTKKDYSHVSLSFDEGLRTLVSYNGGNGLFAPGMNHELLRFFYQKKDANLLVYRVRATKEQKQAVLDEVRKINNEGSSYNLVGLLLPYSHKENIMFCSQFVYHVLKKTGLAYFAKEPHDVKPMDFVELDLKRKLEFHSQVYLSDVLAKPFAAL